ncbi:MAG: hypothetical protein H6765_00725 [Candidatus Peribacteria bacterium]|nr:MAG: hypothetical protein H6765_00725 [Candidatus Peribacteria bacterium]
MATEELNDLNEEFALLHQEPQASSVIMEKTAGIPMQKLAVPGNSTTGVKEFADILKAKDSTIEEKNQVIFALQHKLGELETRLKQMIALPDHTQEKEKLVHNIQKLELERQELLRVVKNEKTWNAVYIGLVLVAAAAIMFFALGI